ncbi:MAG: response regulator transcription factor [Chloroflexi bacterium]|nr:response regulator transcription factor [Chloroflexota bacterium]
MFLADDQVIARKGLALIIGEQPDMEVVGEAEDGDEAVEGVLRLRPDVALMDIDMPGISGIEATRRIAESAPGTSVIIVTVLDGKEFLTEALRAGALGYLLKGAEVEDMARAVRAVHEGDVFIYPRMTTKLVQEYLMRATPVRRDSAYERLSKRQKQVLPLLAENCKIEAIAEMLGVSPYTVRTFLQRIMKKLGLHSRADLVLYALRQGIISLDSSSSNEGAHLENQSASQ